MLVCCSRFLKNSFLPRGIENGQLLQYGHLPIKLFCKRKNVHVRTAEWCENGNAMHLNNRGNETER